MTNEGLYSKRKPVAVFRQKSNGSFEKKPYATFSSISECATYLRTSSCCLGKYINRGFVFKRLGCKVEFWEGKIKNPPGLYFEFDESLQFEYEESQPEKKIAPVKPNHKIGGPLLKGLCTHRMGSYTGGQW